ncbi:MAG: hypothetical protein C5B50_27185 [Verrucomicrobia bacterium]|nr:MAG: hypothetical protein C5B50_27185 [Verrucomicrobiota bacterium]
MLEQRLQRGRHLPERPQGRLVGTAFHGSDGGRNLLEDFLLSGSLVNVSKSPAQRIEFERHIPPEFDERIAFLDDSIRLVQAKWRASTIRNSFGGGGRCLAFQHFSGELLDCMFIQMGLFIVGVRFDQNGRPRIAMPAEPFRNSRHQQPRDKNPQHH